MKRVNRAAILAAAAFSILSCSREVSLPQGDWNPDVHSKISAMLKECGKSSKGYDATARPYAVFDFDNTSIINDVEISLLNYQLINLRFRLTPDEMYEALTGCLPDIDIPICGNLTARMLAEDITADYRLLYDRYIGKYDNPHAPEAQVALAEIRNTDEYKDFAAKYAAFYPSVSKTYDYATDCIWILKGLNGMTTEEITELTKESCRYFTAMGGTHYVVWESPEMGVCGKVSGAHPEGIGISNEMKSLYRTLKANGIDVYIVSASLETIVEAMACGSEFGFDMDPENVFGLRMKETADGRFSADYDEGYVQTFKEGKTGAIRKYIAPSHGGKGPCLVAGDSNGDYNMLTDFDDMRVGLIIDCGNNGRIDALASSGDPKIAVQSRNLAQGCFVAAPTWSDEFGSDEIDWTVWSKIPRDVHHWSIHMSDYDGCYEMRDGCLVLKGIVNPGIEGDDAPLLTGGVWTVGKHSFGYGRLEIRAKIGEAGGAWPALWMMPQGGEPSLENEYGGEIDICEKLNFDDHAFQTLHTRYTLNDTTGHVHGGRGSIARNEFNIYAVEHYRDSIKLFINDVCTLNYKRQPELGPLQWSFDKKFALYVDMQVGAPWPGEAKLEDLPVEMAIDWIRFYEYPEE